MVRETKLYDCLGVQPNASDKEITKAYRKLALKHHPDRPNGDAEKFREAQTAYEVLTDTTKRATYDRHGQQGLDEPQPSGFSGFAGFPGQQRQQRPTKEAPITFDLNCSLEQIFSGCTRKLNVKHKKICSPCQGKGGSGTKSVCDDCRGNGSTMYMRPLGPGLLQQVVRTCTTCQGSGHMFPPKNLCRTCSGGGTVSAQTIVEAVVPPGAKDREEIVCMEKGNESVGLTTGDLLLIVKVKPHDTFKRHGDNLFITKHISLLHALTGFTIDIPHLDGITFTVASTQNTITNNCVQVIRERGLPGKQGHGDLYIEFVVDFPTKLTCTNTQKNNLALLLGGSLVNTQNKEHQHATPIDLEVEKEQWAQQQADSDQQFFNHRQQCTQQ